MSAEGFAAWRAKASLGAEGEGQAVEHPAPGRGGPQTPRVVGQQAVGHQSGDPAGRQFEGGHVPKADAFGALRLSASSPGVGFVFEHVRADQADTLDKAAADPSTGLQALFQPLHRVAQSWLRHAQPGRRAGGAAFLRHDRERRQIVQFATGAAAALDSASVWLAVQSVSGA